MKNLIVLTGATGNTGQVIAQELLRRGIPFVAMVRSDKNRARLAALGIQTVTGDFDDPASMERALAGAEKAYLVCTPDEKLIPRETAFIAAAKKAGVRHIVKCSAYMAGIDAPTPNLRSHGVIEKALVESGLDYTIVRPHGFMQTFTLFSWDVIQKAGAFTLPHGDGAMPLVDVRDAAMVGVKALLEPEHACKAYDVTGPELINGYQQAAILSRVMGRKITYFPGPELPFVITMLILGVPRVPREHVVKIARMTRAHQLEKIHPTLQELGMRPTTYEQFVRDLVAGRTGGGNSFQPPETVLTRAMGTLMPAMMRLQVRMSTSK